MSVPLPQFTALPSTHRGAALLAQHVGLERQAHIRAARDRILFSASASAVATNGVDGWIERSWLRCLDQGHRPDRAPNFNAVSEQARKRILQDHRPLLNAAQPVLEKLVRAIADTGYFAILTNQHGVVLDARGVIDHTDPRADLITRVGRDLSETSVGTTAIGAALTELQPVWLHQGEHFFNANCAYSCAGAPVFGPHGECVGMLDLTGIQALERPELRHLVSQSARNIENALTMAQLDAPVHSRGLLVRLNWPGAMLGIDTDGLLSLDADGFVLGANPSARQMVPQLAGSLRSLASATPVHCTELLAVPMEVLYSAARRSGTQRLLEVPLWNGLRLHALPLMAEARTHDTAPQQLMDQSGVSARPAPAASARQPLRDIETALIRQAVNDARGNVVQAAKALGISRATVYRRLGRSARA